MLEDRYEAIEIVVKSRDDGRAWHDVLWAVLGAGCTGGPCTCGVEHLSGTAGTLDECFRWLGEWDDKTLGFRELTIDQEEG